MTQANDVDDAFAALVRAFSRRKGVTFGGKGFGASALKVNEKIFAMISSRGEFVVKLPAARVRELIAADEATSFEPRPGRAMKEWAVVPLAAASRWRALADEALRYVGGEPG